MTSLRRLALWVLGLLPLAILLAAWQLLGREEDPRLPPPSDWPSALRGLNERGLLMPAIATTTQAFVLALVLSLLLGVAIGILVGSSPKANQALNPLLESFRVTPPPAIVPIVVLLLGTTLLTTVTVVVFAAVWPILLNTASAVRTMPAVRTDMSRTLNLTPLSRVWKVDLPSLVPSIALGVRVAAPVCLVVVLVAEMLASTGGVGQLLIERQRSYDAAAVFGLLALVGALGLVLNLAVASAESVLTRNFSTSPRSH